MQHHSKETILISAPPAYEFVGTLLHTSARSFRAQCNTSELRRGDRVNFRHSKGKGCAVVLWTRILRRTMEAGFHITS
jgi:hypothetical protein